MRQASTVLSPREKQVLGLIILGHGSKEISVKLKLSFFTVQTHRKNMLKKFGVKNTAALIATIYKP